jgi:hypothetical protein
LNERLASSQQQLADLQALREVDTLEMETRQVGAPAAFAGFFCISRALLQ